MIGNLSLSGTRLDAAVAKAAFAAILGMSILLGSVHNGSGAETAPERSLSTRVIQSGHSLTDPIPSVLEKFIRASDGLHMVIGRSTIPGSPMEVRWKDAPDPSLPNARTQIGDYEILVLTERVPLSNTLPWHNSPEEALRWFDHAWKNGNGGKGAETILYATWIDIDSGPDFANPYNDPEGHIPFRDRLSLEFVRWIQILDFVNAERAAGSPPMRLIPATLVMAAAYDDIAAGTAPHLSDFSQLFADTIHVNDAGAYLVSLAHFMVIYGRDPRELPEKAGKPETLHPETARWMRELVWRVVGEYDATVRTE